MSGNADTNYEVIFTDAATVQFQKILDYLFFKLGNVQATNSVREDIEETARRLSHVADKLKPCTDPKLHSLGYRTIHLKRHKYFMLYKIMNNQVYVIGIYHDLQDYENILH